jgi:hypothetical protein
MDNNLAGAVADEAFLHGLVDECQQGVVIAIDVQQANLEEFSSVGFTEFSELLRCIEISLLRSIYQETLLHASMYIYIGAC